MDIKTKYYAIRKYYVELPVIVLVNTTSGKEHGKRHIAQAAIYPKKYGWGEKVPGLCLCGTWLEGRWGSTDERIITDKEVTCKTCLKLIEKYGIIKE